MYLAHPHEREGGGDCIDSPFAVGEAGSINPGGMPSANLYCRWYSGFAIQTLFAPRSSTRAACMPGLFTFNSGQIDVVVLLRVKVRPKQVCFSGASPQALGHHSHGIGATAVALVYNNFQATALKIDLLILRLFSRLPILLLSL